MGEVVAVPLNGTPHRRIPPGLIPLTQVRQKGAEKWIKSCIFSLRAHRVCTTFGIKIERFGEGNPELVE